MSNLVLKVKREVVAACMTCPLCNELLRDATTISECLHTLCRKCINDKISDEELDCCPVCNIDLGCVPLEKLRPDHSLQDLRAKIFPFKRKKVNAPQAAPSATLPARRKERSLSSLVASTPKVSSQGATDGNRIKTITRKAAALRVSSSAMDKVTKEEYSEEEHAEGSSSPETLKKFTQSKIQGSSSAERRDFINSKVEDENDSSEVKLDLWKPLNCLVEIANRSISSQAVLDAASSRQEKRSGPVWFSLVASEDQKGDAALPQIPSRYLRIKDGNMPVSVIQKYLVRKLDLTSEAEVEIRCMGQTVVPSLQLRTLIDLWLQATSTPERYSASIGSSAKDFVIVLTYARKVPGSE
ncbi:E3 ubiquitin protein ligase DRIP2-like isoform X1 [Tripterygium wilfordii]|uniref:E3 ubiquitin protein ligase DRIP2-like isoform X1 n=1 Tax=Tripterygium wilfordii TaxID=458696 RepID=A0A7J7D6D4_TRIWF|nr:E3 ubiquitin protein ligase DRIP1-like [Tripterygium wilfordii]KAF5741871.1 E3 ubiquitin protein ligase DRIP2-like isoform X1 [Tripterygium wilfordii]